MLGPIELPGPPLRFDGLPRMTHTAPPALGQQTATCSAGWKNESDDRVSRHRSRLVRTGPPVEDEPYAVRTRAH